MSTATELQTLIEEQGRLAAEYRTSVDERLAAVESGGTGREERAKLDTMSDRLDELQDTTDKIAKRAKEAAEARDAADEAVAEIRKKADGLETTLARYAIDPDQSPDEARNQRAADREFHRVMLAVRNKLSAGTALVDADIDFDSIHAYGSAFPNYLRRDEKALAAVEQRALAAGSDPDGGYLVPTQMSARIVDRIRETTPLRQFATVETISAANLVVPADPDDVSVGWVGETASRTETTTPQIQPINIPAQELYAEPRATQQMLEDAGIDVEAWLAGKIADKMAREEATQFVNGTGVNQPRGFLTYASGTSWGQIEQISAGASAALTADGVVTLKYGLEDGYSVNGTWAMRRTTRRDVRLLKDGDGRYIWGENLIPGEPPTLLGDPVMRASDMPAVAGGALCLAYGDFRRAYTIVDRMGISVLRDPYTAKPFVKFYTRKRVGGAVVDFNAIKIGVSTA